MPCHVIRLTRRTGNVINECTCEMRSSSLQFLSSSKQSVKNRQKLVSWNRKLPQVFCVVRSGEEKQWDTEKRKKHAGGLGY